MSGAEGDTISPLSLIPPPVSRNETATMRPAWLGGGYGNCQKGRAEVRGQGWKALLCHWGCSGRSCGLEGGGEPGGVGRAEKVAEARKGGALGWALAARGLRASAGLGLDEEG